MSKRFAGNSAPPAAAVAAPRVPSPDRWQGKLLILVAGVVLLTLAFAPLGQFYFAWVGLVPWLLVVHRGRSLGKVFVWSWLAGTLFFIANMWWLAYVTIPGMLGLLTVLGVYWGLAGMVLWASGAIGWSMSHEGGWRARLGPVLAALAIAAVWVGLEWLRGNWPFNGLPWLFLGHTQTPALVMCQIADATSAYGVSFWVAMVNATALLAWLNHRELRRLVPLFAATALLVVAVFAYGWWRMRQATLGPGPTVMVVQSNIPQDTSGRKGASLADRLDFHLRTTSEALSRRPGVNLVVWSETMVGPLNPEAQRFADRVRAILHELPPEKQNLAREYILWSDANHQIGDLAGRFGVWALVGAEYQGAYDNASGRFTDARNSAYLYSPEGRLSGERYDKVHLVPFGEYIPFKESFPALYRMFLGLSPYSYDYTLTAGREDALTVFRIHDASGRRWRLAVPICFEDIDSRLVARMFRPDGPDAGKRADMLVNLTNDGWYRANENSQHLQAAVFRSIENRVPTARSVNTGISGFVDPLGRVDRRHLVGQGEAGVAVAQVMLDSRLSFYTRYGDVFAVACAAATAALAAWPLKRWILSRRTADKQKA